jgi:exodeoxyribonuclease V alpha subunit
MMAPPELAASVDAGVISGDDVAAVALLVEIASREPTPPALDLRAWIALGLALRAPRDGHTCVLLDDIADQAGGIDLVAAGHLDWPTDPASWRRSLVSAGPLVGDPGSRAPFILDGNRLYLARSLHEEREIARRLTADGGGIEILLGGPGTGKTTQVAKRLIELYRVAPETRIALAAPTGKAAARMQEALRNRLHDDHAPDEVRHAAPEVRAAVEAARPVTIHKLLGYRPHGTPRYRFSADNPLRYDLVVVDEASMLSSSLMHHLLAALGAGTRLLLVGDPHQLASVDAGSVLGDIAAAARDPAAPLADRTTTLTVRHRFGPRIGGLADAILAGAPGIPQALAILAGRWTPAADAQGESGTGPADDAAAIRWVQPGTPAFDELVAEVVAHARGVCELAERGEARAALDTRQQLQVLCAHREGPFGVAGFNALVERRLGAAASERWYAGRPLMVSRNNPALDLFNGDMGVVVPAADRGRSDAAFPAGKGVRLVPVSRLEDVATVHALTIHKSQGSEYAHVIVVLPEQPSRIVTRELLYTGVTRATRRVTIVGSEEVIRAAIARPIRRATGLADRLGAGQPS